MENGANKFSVEISWVSLSGMAFLNTEKMNADIALLLALGSKLFVFYVALLKDRL